MKTITDRPCKCHNTAIMQQSQSKDIRSHHLLLLLKQLLLLWKREYVPPMPTAPLRTQSARNSDSASVLLTSLEEKVAGTLKLLDQKDTQLHHLLLHQLLLHQQHQLGDTQANHLTQQLLQHLQR